jgi:hypothetical protein
MESDEVFLNAGALAVGAVVLALITGPAFTLVSVAIIAVVLGVVVL